MLIRVLIRKTYQTKKRNYTKEAPQREAQSPTASGCRVEGFRVYGFRVEGLELRVWGSRG